MKTNLTRDTFDPANHYSSVRTKQGAMQLDADWNEQVDILGRRETTSLLDIIGPFGVPQTGGGFRIVAAPGDLTPDETADPANAAPPALDPGDLLITAGRGYLDGRLIENDRITSLTGQPHLPDAPVLSAPGLHLLFLDVWERTITSLEDPEIREVALGGPDTATRTQRIWQIRSLQVGDSGTPGTCLTSFEGFDDATAPSTGQLAARAEPDPAASGPCVVPENAGYRSLENQLYRVECIRAGTRASARFVWSRENGSIVTNWVAQNGPELTVSSPGPDQLRGFANGNWIEVFDRGRELRGEAGILVRVLVVRGNVLEIDPATASEPIILANFPEQPRIRRWDSDGMFAANGANWTPLEQGVEVRFAAGSYGVGDYWMIPARTNSGDVEWPRTGGTPDFLLAEGITHSYARLAMVDIDSNGVTTISDCRPLFPPLTGLLQLDYVGGDGQEAMPDLTAPVAGVNLDSPLQVAVSRGTTPVEGVPVRFSISSGGGQVNGSNIAVVTTDSEGVAAANWRLGNAAQPQRVTAQLLDAADAPQHVPVRFSANFSTAAEVAFDPRNCPPLANARTVQQAIDILCQNSGGGTEPGFRIVRMLWAQTGRIYRHDGPATVEDMRDGLRIVCDELVDATTVENRPVVFVTAILPSDNGMMEMRRLSSALQVNNNEIFWLPDATAIAMVDEFIDGLAPLELTIRGDNIRALGDPDAPLIWLDADGLERPGRQILPTGDQRRGGTLVSWFRALRERVEPGFGFVDVRRIDGGGLAGRLVVSETGEGLPGVQVVIARTGLGVATRTAGQFVFQEVPAQAFVLSATIAGQTESAQVGPLLLGPDLFRTTDFIGVRLGEIEGISASMLRRLERAGLTDPVVIANLNEEELSRRTGMANRTAITVLRRVRTAARR